MSAKVALASPNKSDTWWPEDPTKEDDAAKDLQPYLRWHQGNIIRSFLVWHAADLGHLRGDADGLSHATRIYSSPIPWGTLLLGHTQVHIHGLGNVVATERGPRAVPPSHA